MVLSARTLPPVWQVGAVVHRVAVVLDLADRVAAHRARLAGAVVDRAGPVLRRRHVVAAALVGQALVDALADRLDQRGRVVAGSSLFVMANGESCARWQISLARRRPSPAMRRWSRRKPWTRVFSPPRSSIMVVDVDVGGVGAEVVERLVVSGSPAHHPHAGLALGAGLGEQQRPAVGEAPSGPARRGAWPTASRRA